MDILTVTPNVAIDQTVTLDRLVPGRVHRAKAARSNAGGKGVNVSSCLADWGLPSSATGFLGRDNAALFEDLCEAKGIDDAFLRVNGSSRVNIKLVDQAGTTDINLPGLSIDPGALSSFDARVEDLARGARLAVLAGSLPQGCPEGFYASLIAGLDRAGIKTLLDTSGRPLARALAGDVMPYAVKPNNEELAQLAGRVLPTRADVLTEARGLLQRGVRLVAVSLGGEGALFLSGERALHAGARAENLASTVGAGDAMVAGIVAALHEAGDNEPGLERAARLGTAFAVTKLGLQGPSLPPRESVEAAAGKVEIREV